MRAILIILLAIGIMCICVAQIIFSIKITTRIKSLESRPYPEWVRAGEIEYGDTISMYPEDVPTIIWHNYKEPRPIDEQAIYDAIESADDPNAWTITRPIVVK